MESSRPINLEVYPEDQRKDQSKYQQKDYPGATFFNSTYRLSSTLNVRPFITYGLFESGTTDKIKCILCMDKLKYEKYTVMPCCKSPCHDSCWKIYDRYMYTCFKCLDYISYVPFKVLFECSHFRDEKTIFYEIHKALDGPFGFGKSDFIILHRTADMSSMAYNYRSEFRIYKDKVNKFIQKNRNHFINTINGLFVSLNLNLPQSLVDVISEYLFCELLKMTTNTTNDTNEINMNEINVDGFNTNESINDDDIEDEDENEDENEDEK
jgi:hypothetical protein